MCAGTEVKTQNTARSARWTEQARRTSASTGSRLELHQLRVHLDSDERVLPRAAGELRRGPIPRRTARNYGLIGVTGSSGQDGIKLGCLGGTDAFRARLRTNDSADLHLETDVDSGNLMECVADDWYFVALVLDEDTVGGLIVSQTYTLRVTRYDVEADGTLGSMVYEYYDQTTAVAGEEVSAADDGDGLLIGSFTNWQAGQKHWWGRIDDFAIWDRALTSDDYTSLRDLYGVPTPAPTMCQDEWAGLVGVAARSMSFPADQWSDLFTEAELAALSALDARRGLDADDARDVVRRRSPLRHGGRRRLPRRDGARRRERRAAGVTDTAGSTMT